MCRLRGLHGRIFTYPEEAEIQLPFSDFVNISEGSMAHFLSHGKISPNSQVIQSTFFFFFYRALLRRQHGVRDTAVDKELKWATQVAQQ